MEDNIKSKKVVLFELGLPETHNCKILWVPLVTSPEDNLLIDRHAKTQNKNKVTVCAEELLLLFENTLKKRMQEEIEEFRVSSIFTSSPEDLEEEIQKLLTRLAAITRVKEKNEEKLP